MRTTTIRAASAVSALLLAAAALTLPGSPMADAPAHAAPGNPGVPGEPPVVFHETFEAGQGATATSLGAYVGVAGQTHTANPHWLLAAQCNGVIIQYESALFPAGYCDAGGQDGLQQNNVRRLADVLGQVGLGVEGGTSAGTVVQSSTPASRQNHALAEWTSTLAGPDDALVMDTSAIAVPVTGTRFYSASVDVAETSCEHEAGVNNSRLHVALIAGGTTVPVTDDPIRACTDPNVRFYTSPGLGGWAFGGNYVKAGRFFTDSSTLLAAPDMQALRIQIRNETGSANGNDFGFDNIRIVDTTPQLDKSFSPTSVPTGGVSTLTLTVTNTADLAAKDGWGFTDALPDGLVVATPAQVGGTCDADVIAAPGSDQVEVTNGSLSAGDVSCTVTVGVTSSTPVGAEASPKTYQNCASNMEDVVGLDLPGCASVEFYSEPELQITKTADRSTLPVNGGTVNYTVTVSNVGTGDFTTANPARVEDDLSRVLDDATYGGGAQARDGANALTPTQPTFTSPNLAWSGPLAVGQSVTITYSVTYTGLGNKVLANVACVPQSQAAGAECAEVQTPAVAYTQWKTVQASSDPLVAGSTLEYTLHFRNDGVIPAPIDAVDHLIHVVDDAEVTGGPTVSTTDLSATFNAAQDRLAVTGDIPRDETITVTYTVTIRADGQRGDNTASNFLLNAGDTPPDEPDCTPANAQLPDCTQSPIGQIEPRKTADPRSGTRLTDGDEVTYTLEFENVGHAAAPMDYVDHLADVLDDADLVGDLSADTGLTATHADQTLTVTGSVDAGQTLTVTYTVRVRDYASQANHALGNFVTRAGEDPPEVCQTSGRLCTEHPLVPVPDPEPEPTPDPDPGPDPGPDPEPEPDPTPGIDTDRDGALPGAGSSVGPWTILLGLGALTAGVVTLNSGRRRRHTP